MFPQPSSWSSPAPSRSNKKIQLSVIPFADGIHECRWNYSVAGSNPARRKAVAQVVEHEVPSTLVVAVVGHLLHVFAGVAPNTGGTTSLAGGNPAWRTPWRQGPVEKGDRFRCTSSSCRRSFHAVNADGTTWVPRKGGFEPLNRRHASRRRGAVVTVPSLLSPLFVSTRLAADRPATWALRAAFGECGLDYTEPGCVRAVALRVHRARVPPIFVVVRCAQRPCSSPAESKTCPSPTRPIASSCKSEPTRAKPRACMHGSTRRLVLETGAACTGTNGSGRAGNFTTATMG